MKKEHTERAESADKEHRGKGGFYINQIQLLTLVINHETRKIHEKKS
jgi:hypothetical protein